MRIDDFIVLGKTVPEKSKKYGEKVCMAGLSTEMKSLLRLYPIDIYSKIPTRSTLVVEVERNNLDSRLESWTLKDRSTWSIRSVGEKVGKAQLIEVLESQVAQSIDNLNENRKSLGVLKVDSFDIIMKTRKNIDNDLQLKLFDDFQEFAGFKTASDYFQIPYFRINGDDKQRCLQIREWGVYELIRKGEESNQPISAIDIKKALHIKDNSTVYLVVGNMNNVRNVWIIIKVFVFDGTYRQKTLF